MNIANTVSGYLEINYWKSAYLNAGNCGSQNVAAFASVNLYNDPNIVGSNYEYLFEVTNPGSDSLFDLTILKDLISLG